MNVNYVIRKADATSGIDENLFISKYLLKLPSKDEMERWLYKELKELR